MHNSLKQIRDKKPLILNLTNIVTMDIVANTVLAIGAAPIMTSAIEELAELVAMSSAININLGTLHTEFIKQCRVAIDLATKHQIPIVLDPVGAGATELRTQTAYEFMAHATIIRGNASEIMALSGAPQHTKGVESVNATEEAIQAATAISLTHHNITVVSGKTDYITDGKKLESCHGGSPLMSKVTGMGCSMSAVIGAFLSVCTDPFEASKKATSLYNDCGKKAARKAQAPGAFRTHFINALYEVGRTDAE